MSLPEYVLFQQMRLFGLAALQPQIGTPCNNQSCSDLVNLINEWTTWGAWLIGALGVLWVIIGFYKALSYTRASLDYFKGSPAMRMVASRAVEAAAIFFIAWRVGAIGQFVESFIDKDTTIGGNTDPTVIGRPLAAIIAYAIALAIQCFLIFLLPRQVFQMADLLYGILMGSSGAPTQMFQRNALSVFLEGIALGVGIVFAPNLITWLLNVLT